MRCIEIGVRNETWGRTNAINRNMRCIEIAVNTIIYSVTWRLIETWDVLK